MKLLKTLLKLVGFLVLIIFLIVIINNLLTTPSNDRDWSEDQQVLPYAEIDDNLISIKNIRNFKYNSTTDYEIGYYDKTLDLDKLEKVWFVIVPFAGIPGSAHTFLSFEFEGDDFISISVEVRKEKGETYEPIKGLFNKYELMYVVADERDVVGLRTNHRMDSVYLYPASATKEKVQALFLEMLGRVNKLKDHPEFYNTLTNACTSNIVEHINNISPNKVPVFNLSVLFPASSDKLAHKLGLLDIKETGDFETEIRPKYYISDKAREAGDDNINFSRRIRE